MRGWGLLLLCWGCCEALSLGSFRLDFGGNSDLSPAQYREYIKSRTPPTPWLKIKSPLWYIYEDDKSLQHKTQMAELKLAEMQLGVKFWKIHIKNSGMRKFFRQLWMAGMPPVDYRLRMRPLHRSRPETPYFYNMFTGEGLAGVVCADTLKQLALGKPLNRGPWQEGEPSGFAEVSEELEAEEEKEMMSAEDTYSDQYFIRKYRQDRDRALRAHRRQYRRRKLLSKLWLAKPLPAQEEGEERTIEFDKSESTDPVVQSAMAQLPSKKKKSAEKKKGDGGGDKKEKKGRR